jgi:hypothetical protein
MASSLDDMEEYELLQIELDRFLKVYYPLLPSPSPELEQLFNLWIEYICFLQHSKSWSVIASNEYVENFIIWVKPILNEGYSDQEVFHQLQQFNLSFQKYNQ